ncbi:acyl-CoA dehydratase activase [Geobacter sp. DSM 9736]|uniref:acyl-CoA dehydratase activase n=1 Tax=Geobacter sp. DSM 9736 TaxID=1277350 RepID=UPI000B5EEC61|nr:acyl-CoA dehydratase activase [Geobacter sp. DSM 9736]SNB47883.1 CoA-substrate-specific enzyme activase, putative [Geobacter sp. DSM 9736]
MENRIHIGIDLGSRKAKFALIREGDEPRLADFDTVLFYKRFGRLEGGELCLDLPATGFFTTMELEEASIAATGYGRNTLSLRGATVISEIRAHVAGVLHQTGLRDFTLLDLGGQDTKVALVRSGRLDDFVMNDKCAASSGRYLENMAAILEVSLDELSSYWEDPVKLDATCGIFGESELIGQILQGHPVPRLCAGVNQTLVKRVLPMLRRYPSSNVVVTGGVARNQGLIKLLERDSGMQVVVPTYPQHNGAIGCATFRNR